MRILYFLIFALCTISCYSQNLTLDEILTLRKKDLAGVEEYLSMKGWSFVSSKEGSDESLGNADFAYNKGSFNNKAEAFLIYLFSKSSEYKRITLQISKKEKYTSYLTRVKSFGCKLIDSEINDGSIKKYTKE
jgi:hypothetical protein